MSSIAISATTNSGIVIEEFKAVTRNSLRGFARVRMPSGMILHEVVVHCTNGAWWVSPASRPALDSSGKQMVKAGKPVWQPIVTFAPKEIRDRFSTSVITALRISHPEVFNDECL